VSLNYIYIIESEERTFNESIIAVSFDTGISDAFSSRFSRTESDSIFHGLSRPRKIVAGGTFVFTFSQDLYLFRFSGRGTHSMAVVPTVGGGKIGST